MHMCAVEDLLSIKRRCAWQLRHDKRHEVVWRMGRKAVGGRPQRDTEAEGAAAVCVNAAAGQHTDLPDNFMYGSCDVGQVAFQDIVDASPSSSPGRQTTPCGMRAGVMMT